MPSKRPNKRDVHRLITSHLPFCVTAAIVALQRVQLTLRTSAAAHKRIKLDLLSLRFGVVKEIRPCNAAWHRRDSFGWIRLFYLVHLLSVGDVSFTNTIIAGLLFR